jgi:hypothetical protein
VRAARSLIDDGTLARRAVDGAVVLAVCAGYQIVGKSFPGADGVPHEGVGLLDIVTAKGDGARAVGEVVADVTGASLPPLTGFENHGGRTTLAADTVPLARVTAGIGNGDGSGTEGAVTERVLGTYLHGPVLARNPALADLLLAWALDTEDLAPLDDGAAEALRLERLTAVGGSGRGGRRKFTEEERIGWHTSAMTVLNAYRRRAGVALLVVALALLVGTAAMAATTPTAPTAPADSSAPTAPSTAVHPDASGAGPDERFLRDQPHLRRPAS